MYQLKPIKKTPIVLLVLTIFVPMIVLGVLVFETVVN